MHSKSLCEHRSCSEHRPTLKALTSSGTISKVLLSNCYSLNWYDLKVVIRAMYTVPFAATKLLSIIGTNILSLYQRHRFNASWSNIFLSQSQITAMTRSVLLFITIVFSPFCCFQFLSSSYTAIHISCTTLCFIIWNFYLLPLPYFQGPQAVSV